MRLATNTTARGLLLGLLLVQLGLLSGCDLKMPWDPAPPAADPSAEEAPTAEEDAAVEEGEDGEAVQKTLPPPPKPTYQQLSDFPFQTLSLVSGDGFSLSGRLYDAWQVAHPPQPPQPAASEEDAEEADPEDPAPAPPSPPKPDKVYPLVILLHGLGGTSQDWFDWIPALVRRGYAVLALDIRGHGHSTRIMATGDKPWRLLSELEWRASQKDLDQWMRYATTGGVHQLAPQVRNGPCLMMGVGLGANLALLGAGQHPEWVKAVVAVAPGLSIKGIEPAVPMLQFNQPVFFVASQTDPTALADTEKLYKIAQGPKQIRLFKDIGGGLDIMRHYPPLKTELLGWLAKALPPVQPPAGLFPSAPPPAHPTPAPKPAAPHHPTAQH